MNNTCRTCLKTPAKKDISGLDKGIEDVNVNYIDVMLFCLDIKVTEDSKITRKLCTNCFKKIVSFYEFKALSLKNDAYWKSLDPLANFAEQKDLFIDDNGIKHENFLETDNFDPRVLDFNNAEIKVEVDLKDEESLGDTVNHEDTLDVEPNIKEENTVLDVELEEEPLSVVQKIKYDKVGGDTIEYASKQTGKPKLVQCKVCPKQFLSLGGRNKHYRTTHLGKKSKCDICGKDVVCLSVHKLQVHNPSAMRHSCSVCERRFVSQSHLDLHMISHTKEYPWECDVCHKKFSSKGLLTKHTRQVHEKERNFKCELCDKAYFGKDKLHDHLKTHTSEKERQICEECGKLVYNLKEHALRHQPKDERRKMQCKGCTKTFYSYSGMKKHYRTTHLGKKYTCDICKKEVVSLSMHKLRMHPTGELPFPCLECGRRFVTQAVLLTHMVTHTRNRPYECDDCHKKFSGKTFLSRHKRQVHERERNQQCEQCPKAFFTKTKLQEHLRSHTNERPYTCSECGLSFSTRQGLTRHLLTHSDVKKYHCQLCSMSFKVIANLRAHMISHTKEKRYPCGFCGARFGRSDHRNRHEFTAHKKHGQMTDGPTADSLNDDTKRIYMK